MYPGGHRQAGKRRDDQPSHAVRAAICEPHHGSNDCNCGEGHPQTNSRDGSIEPAIEAVTRSSQSSNPQQHREHSETKGERTRGVTRHDDQTGPCTSCDDPGSNRYPASCRYGDAFHQLDDGRSFLYRVYPVSREMSPPATHPPAAAASEIMGRPAVAPNATPPKPAQPLANRVRRPIAAD
jgi:hypothetical protein